MKAPSDCTRWYPFGDSPLPAAAPARIPASSPAAARFMPTVSRRSLLLLLAAALALAALVCGAGAGGTLSPPTKSATGCAATAAPVTAAGALPGGAAVSGGGALVTGSMRLLRSGAGGVMGDAELAAFRGALAALALGDPGAAASVSI